jgi:hypothetical protein
MQAGSFRKQVYPQWAWAYLHSGQQQHHNVWYNNVRFLAKQAFLMRANI